jgi:hypothetical protein
LSITNDSPTKNKKLSKPKEKNNEEKSTMKIPINVDDVHFFTISNEEQLTDEKQDLICSLSIPS